MYKISWVLWCQSYHKELHDKILFCGDKGPNDHQAFHAVKSVLLVIDALHEKMVQSRQTLESTSSVVNHIFTNYFLLENVMENL